MLSRGVVSAVRPDGGLTPMQQLLVQAVFRSMTGHDADVRPEPITPDAFAALEKAGFSRRGFLKSAGALIVGFSMSGGAKKLGAQAAGRVIALDRVDSWVAIAQDEIGEQRIEKNSLLHGSGEAIEDNAALRHVPPQTRTHNRTDQIVIDQSAGRESPA